MLPFEDAIITAASRSQTDVAADALPRCTAFVFTGSIHSKSVWLNLSA